LPIKIGLRVLYVLLANANQQIDFQTDGQWINLETYKEEASKVAAWFGDEIRKYENTRNKLRDGRISAGLPKTREFKSKMRYKAHFLASMRGNNTLDGAMCFLRFINLSGDVKEMKGNIMIGLTGPGANFAKLVNPVIDNNNFDQSLSDGERTFYLEHVRTHVKGESSAIKWLLNTLARGITGREAINKELKKELGEIWGNPSDQVINTQRAGLMSRMLELGLSEREKKGIKVSYSVSDKGKNFIM